MKTVLLLFLFLFSQPCIAGCSVNASGLNFGVYRASLQSFDLLSTGSLDLVCDSGSIGVGAKIYLSGGQSTNVHSRFMTNGTDNLFYNLYLSSSRDVASVWGDGVGAAAAYSWTSQPSDKIHIFGKIPAAQSVSPGVYSDIIQITLVF